MKKNLLKALLAGSLGLIGALQGRAVQVAAYDFSDGVNPSFLAPEMESGSAVDAAASDLKGASHTSGNPLPSYMADAWTTGVNYVQFVLVVRPEYALVLEDLVFDYRSEALDGYNGPLQYNVRVGTDLFQLQSLSGGWQDLVRDDAWHARQTAAVASVAAPWLSGQIYVQIAGRGAEQQPAYWWLDNIEVHGSFVPNPPLVSRTQWAQGAPQLEILPYATGSMHRVERASVLIPDVWQPVHSFTATGSTNWSEAWSNSWGFVYYRVVVE